MYKTKMYTLIGITDSYLYIVGCQKTSSTTVRMMNYRVRKITGLKDDEVGKILSEEVRTQKFNAKEVVAVLDRKNAFLKQIILPSRSPDELRKMTGLQMIQYVPNVDDVSWDFIVLHKEPDGRSRILCVAAYNEVIQRYLKIFSSADLHPVRLTLSSFGLLQIINENKAIPKFTGPTILIYLDPTGVEVCFIQNGMLYFSRHIPMDREEFKNDKTHLLDQINLTITSFRREKLGEDFGRFILISFEPEIETIKSSLEILYKVPTEICPPDKLLPYLDRSGGLLSQPETSAFPVLGLAVTDIEHLPNLLPAHLKDRKKTYQKKLLFIKTLVLFIVTVVLTTIALGIQGYKKSARLNETEEKLTQMKIQVKEAEESIRRLNILKENLDSRVRVIDVIQELYTLTPSDISYDIMELTRDGKIVLEGQTAAAAKVNQLQSSLLGSKIFSDINLEYATRRPSEQGEKTFFRMTGRKGRRP